MILFQENCKFLKTAEWSIEPGSSIPQSLLSKKCLRNIRPTRVVDFVVSRLAVAIRCVVP